MPQDTGRQGRRQRRIARRRQHILAAAARVFARKGFDQATVKEIADEADVAEGTLYNYFDGKRDILLAIAGDTEASAVAVRQAAEGLDDRAAMILMFEKAFDVSQAQLPFTQTLFSAAWMDDEILEQFVAARLKHAHAHIETYIAQRVAAGAFRPLDPGLGARLVMGMYASLVLPAIRGVAPLPSPQERRAQIEMMVDLILDGVRAPG